jgi:hypothetical protein
MATDPPRRELTDKILKRKQANRDSARRSKMRKKQEVDALSLQSKELHDVSRVAWGQGG